MSRWGDPVARERDASVYSSGRRRRDTRELDIEIDERRGARPARSVPDFLREDYDRRSMAGALVVREEDDYDRPRRRAAPREEKEEIIIREDKRAGPRSRIEVDDDVRSVRSSRTARTERPRPRPRSEERSREEIDIRISRDEVDRPRGHSRAPTARDTERDEVIIRKSEGDRRRSVVEKDEIIIKERDGERVRPRPREIEKEEVIIRRGRAASSSSSSSSSSPSPPPRRQRDASVTERVIYRPRERSQPPPREKMVARETEEFIIRRRRPSPSPSPSPSPPPAPRERREQEIIIRRTERSPTPPPPAPAPPPPEPEPVVEEEIIRRPIIKEEIHRDIIYHHRHYDHGVEIVRREPTPPPPVVVPESEPEPQREEELEIAIRTRDSDGEREDIIIKDKKSDKKHKRRHRSRAPSAARDDVEIDIDTRSVARRDRSMSPVRSRSVAPASGYDLAGEAEYYNRRQLERARVGEAYNGATREWELVDVPPGTSRVRMDGIGGGTQEVSWQRYNGARRSRFFADGQDFEAYPDFDDRRDRDRDRAAIAPPPPEPIPEPEPVREEPKSSSLEITIREKDRGGNTEVVKKEKKPKEMWTEITKDLVLKEAIEEMGYGFEETEHFFYVMDYLKYDDVLQLVEVSDNIRRQRRRRIKEIEIERDLMERLPPPPPMGDRIYERDVIYERRRR